MTIEKEVIKEAYRLFPDSTSDIHAVDNYRKKVLDDLRSINDNHPKFEALATLYLNLVRLKDRMHKINIEKMSYLISVNRPLRVS